MRKRIKLKKKEMRNKKIIEKEIKTWQKVTENNEEIIIKVEKKDSEK